MNDTTLPPITIPEQTQKFRASQAEAAERARLRRESEVRSRFVHVGPTSKVVPARIGPDGQPDAAGLARVNAECEKLIGEEFEIVAREADPQIGVTIHYRRPAGWMPPGYR